MATWINGWHSLELGTDDDGHRNYKAVFNIESDNPIQGPNPTSGDGPARVRLTPGLPVIGTSWLFGNDVDVWAWCHPGGWVVKPKTPEQPCKFWTVEVPFSTKPVNRKVDTNPDNPGQQDPLFEPDKMSGGFNKFTEQGVIDRFGNYIESSSHEPFGGPENEWDSSKISVIVEQNRALLDIETFAPMVDGVNSQVMWGFPPRCIKLDNVRWSEKFHKQSKYFNRIFEFQIFVEAIDPDFALSTSNMQSRWDRVIRDQGYLVLYGVPDTTTHQWVLKKINGKDPDPGNPSHFIRYTDFNGNPSAGPMPLNGAGLPCINVLNSQTTGCSVCPGGAPTAWVLAGFPAGHYSARANGKEITNTSGCTWMGFFTFAGGTPGANTIAVTLVVGATTSTLTVVGNWGTWMFTKTGAWACLGGNSLTASPGNGADSPPSVSVTPGGGVTTQGTFNVQKYDEFNFFLLGIPTVVGP